LGKLRAFVYDLTASSKSVKMGKASFKFG